MVNTKVIFRGITGVLEKKRKYDATILNLQGSFNQRKNYIDNRLQVQKNYIENIDNVVYQLENRIAYLERRYRRSKSKSKSKSRQRRPSRKRYENDY